VHPAALPDGAREDLSHGLLKTEVRVRGHEAHPTQVTADQLAQEVEPELMILGRAARWTNAMSRISELPSCAYVHTWRKPPRKIVAACRAGRP
jgi:hypothetical protein